MVHFLKFFEVIPVGSTTPIKSYCRIIVTSIYPLHILLEKQIISQDLFQQLFFHAITLELLPLRRKRYMIRKICEEFMEEYDCKIPEHLLGQYEHYCWPGNIVQLERHLRKKLVTSSTYNWEYDYLDQQLFEGGGSVADEYIDTVTNMKRRYINYVYNLNRGNVKKTLKQLKITYPTLKANLP
jgi:transcriptional regulator of acetoin/glycerol metabolism